MNIQSASEKNSLKSCFLNMDLAIFPLNGAVLFPGTSLPLNIFENRYVEMINYSLARSREIGMIQNNEKNRLYNIGCVGKIHSFNETNDGRYLISLQGVSCFRVIKELKCDYNFRIVDAELIEKKDDDYFFSENQKLSILKAYSKYIKIKKINLNLKEIENIEIDQIIKFIAMVSPFNNIDKQALLETSSLLDFYNKLNSIIELELIGNFDNKTIN
ncbi:LON peptidase substrate-binding domain-containing protein [Pelagibacteraceae bacterium]|nr:LON peptidase substrate-binding domain-containing protein [Pelagibacteraceae bacterium]